MAQEERRIHPPSTQPWQRAFDERLQACALQIHNMVNENGALRDHASSLQNELDERNTALNDTTQYAQRLEQELAALRSELVVAQTHWESKVDKLTVTGQKMERLLRDAVTENTRLDRELRQAKREKSPPPPPTVTDASTSTMMAGASSSPQQPSETSHSASPLSQVSVVSLQDWIHRDLRNWDLSGSDVRTVVGVVSASSSFVAAAGSSPMAAVDFALLSAFRVCYCLGCSLPPLVAKGRSEEKDEGDGSALGWSVSVWDCGFLVWHRVTPMHLWLDETEEKKSGGVGRIRFVDETSMSLRPLLWAHAFRVILRAALGREDPWLAWTTSAVMMLSPSVVVHAKGVVYGHDGLFRFLTELHGMMLSHDGEEGEEGKYVGLIERRRGGDGGDASGGWSRIAVLKSRASSMMSGPQFFVIISSCPSSSPLPNEPLEGAKGAWVNTHALIRCCLMHEDRDDDGDVVHYRVIHRLAPREKDNHASSPPAAVLSAEGRRPCYRWCISFATTIDVGSGMVQTSVQLQDTHPITIHTVVVNWQMKKDECDREDEEEEEVQRAVGSIVPRGLDVLAFYCVEAIAMSPPRSRRTGFDNSSNNGNNEQQLQEQEDEAELRVPCTVTLFAELEYFDQEEGGHHRNSLPIKVLAIELVPAPTWNPAEGTYTTSIHPDTRNDEKKENTVAGSLVQINGSNVYVASCCGRQKIQLPLS